MSKRFDDFAKEVTSLLKENNKKLDKLCALVTSMTLLQETVSPEGEQRSAEECAELISDSFLAAVALDHEFSARTKQFEYHLSEFFIDEDPVKQDPKDDKGPPEMQFN